MKKIIALAVFALFLFFVAITVCWTVRFIAGAKLNASYGRTNILILGIGGGIHDGADLTDTIIVLSLDNVKKTVALLSIPRDIWSDSLKDKINSAYHYGRLILAKVTMEDVTGLPIHYAVVIDFSGFTKVIDAVGGIDVNVPVSFTDNQYPCENTMCVYETIHFDAGKEHMDGVRALMYARSRHADGSEGSDFARSRRQQLIIAALKKKITFSRIVTLWKLLQKAIKTDMTTAQIVLVGKRLMSVRQDQIKNISFEQLLDNPPEYLYNNLYVLVPHTSWDDIHAYIKSQL